MLSRSMNCVNRAHPFAVNVVFMGKVEQSLSVLQRKMVTCIRSRVIDLFRRLWFMRSMIGSGLGLFAVHGSKTHSRGRRSMQHSSARQSAVRRGQGKGWADNNYYLR